MNTCSSLRPSESFQRDCSGHLFCITVFMNSSLGNYHRTHLLEEQLLWRSNALEQQALETKARIEEIKRKMETLKKTFEDLNLMFMTQFEKEYYKIQKEFLGEKSPKI